jgi:septal ring factor EnvC (AmiA/AmiB activator)
LQLEKALEEARSRESELQRKLVAQEGRETQLRAEIAQAERRTLNSLQLDEKLREALQMLDREHAAREDEHRENAHIQEQLLHRIEELERLTASHDSSSPTTTIPVPDMTTAPIGTRSTFSFLRRR